MVRNYNENNTAIDKEQGMRIEQINHLTLFKFTDDLGDRLQTLLDKKKVDALTATENLELETIAELDAIFSYINAAIAAKQSDFKEYVTPN